MTTIFPSFLQLYLNNEGYQTVIANDGGEGIDQFRKFQPDLVLLDIMLPVMDGWGVLRTIRQDSKTPVIMLTAKGETTDKVTGLKQGADDYITKPFEMKGGPCPRRSRPAPHVGGRGQQGRKSAVWCSTSSSSIWMPLS